ncbi:MAG: GTP-binding protein, partial [Xanthobacteraceae bacterium]
MAEASTRSPALKPIDSLVVDVITDDVSDAYVSKTLFAVSEFSNVVLAGAKVISGETLLCANLGLGLRLVSEADGVRHTLLFDTGPEGTIFMRNCANLGLRLGEVECIAVSHGHWDHMAALPQAVEAIVREGGQVAVHVNPGMFNERAVRLKSGKVVPVANVPSPTELEKLGARVVNRPDAQLLLDDHFYYSGEIPRVTSFEKGRVDHLSRTGPAAPWEPDPLLMDERMLVVHVRDLGLIVFSACSHAGIVNVCTHARNLFPDIPIYCVMGGLHLGGVMERIIPDTVEGLRPFRISHIITGHCTGWRALHALADAFGDAVPVRGRHQIYLRRRTSPVALAGAGPERCTEARCARTKIPMTAPSSPACAPHSSEPRLPVTVVTGFLGSGKTTLVKHILTNQHGLRTAVIVNEFSELGIDSELIVSADDDMVELENGCICCSINNNFVDAIFRILARDRRVDYLVVETTGLADPLPVVLTFLRSEFRELTRVDSIITVADADSFCLDLFESEAARNQLRYGDVVLLNKCDLVDAARLRTLESSIR